MKKEKAALGILMAGSVMFAGCTSNSSSVTESKDSAQVLETKTETTGENGNEADSSAEEASKENKDPSEILTGKSANEIVADMGFGWNLGNTFDSTGGSLKNISSFEISWGNPIVTQELIDGVKAAGFDTIRIPVTWYRAFSDPDNYTIDPAYMDRVKEVVDYAYNNDMYVILNMHHEAWLNNDKLYTDCEEIADELSAVWTQIADNFADYDQHLIFEGMNEPRMAGTNVEWTGTTEGFQAVNYLSQVFVETVRDSDKGYNDERCVMIPGYAASNASNVLNSITIPTVDGEAVNNVIIEVHSYAPYNFCLNTAQKTFDPENKNDTAEIDNEFINIDEIFLSNGIPVVIDETSATDNGNIKEREKWAYYMASKAASYGVPILLWDNGNGGTGNECHEYMVRATGKQNFPTIIKALMDAKSDTVWGSARKSSDAEEETESLCGGQVIWRNKEGLASTGLWDANYIKIGAQPQYYSEGREIAIVFSGEGEPRMILDSAEKSAWWIPVEPSRIETLNDKKVAYFTYEDMVAEMKKNGVDDPSQLRDMSFLAANDNITTYEISAAGNHAVVTYRVFGEVYFVGSELPKEPESDFKNLKFAGWYTTKTYEEGTEYTGQEVDQDMVVYAKFALENAK